MLPGAPALVALHKSGRRPVSTDRSGGPSGPLQRSPARQGWGTTNRPPPVLAPEPHQGRERRCAVRLVAPLTGLKTGRREKGTTQVPALTGWANLCRPCGPDDKHASSQTCVEQRGLAPLAIPVRHPRRLFAAGAGMQTPELGSRDSAAGRRRGGNDGGDGDGVGSHAVGGGGAARGATGGRNGAGIGLGGALPVSAPCVGAKGGHARRVSDLRATSRRSCGAAP